MAGNGEREALWRERVERWRASGLSQRAFSLKNDYAVRQFGYWVRRLAAQRPAAAMLPVEVKRGVPPAISLHSERGWTMTLFADTPAAWLAELLRAL